MPADLTVNYNEVWDALVAIDIYEGDANVRTYTPCDEPMLGITFYADPTNCIAALTEHLVTECHKGYLPDSMRAWVERGIATGLRTDSMGLGTIAYWHGVTLAGDPDEPADCANCSQPIEADDGIWYHADSMEMPCDPEGEQSRDRMAQP